MIKMNLGKFHVNKGKLNCNLWKKFFACVLVLVLLIPPVIPVFVRNSSSWEWKVKDRISKILSPEFEKTEERIIVMAGRDAVLPCRITNLSDKVVSWIRTKDLHILTSGPVTFTADKRFDLRHVKGSSEWSLKLKKAQVADSGIYECQINTDPKMNRKVTLDVVSDFKDFGESSSNDLDLYMVDDEGVSPHKEPVTRILGEDQFVKTGSTITLTCLILIPGDAITFIDWLKDGRLISFQSSRGGIIVETEKSEKKATSRLTLADVKSKDSGNYTCRPSNAKSHSIGLVVIEGEHTEAMQRSSNESAKTPERRIFLLNAICFLLILAQKVAESL